MCSSQRISHLVCVLVVAYARIIVEMNRNGLVLLSTYACGYKKNLRCYEFSGDRLQ